MNSWTQSKPSFQEVVMICVFRYSLIYNVMHMYTYYTMTSEIVLKSERIISIFPTFINIVDDFWFCHPGIDSGPWSMWWVTPWPQVSWLISAEKILSKRASRWEHARTNQWILRSIHWLLDLCIGTYVFFWKTKKGVWGWDQFAVQQF